MEVSSTKNENGITLAISGLSAQAAIAALQRLFGLDGNATPEVELPFRVASGQEPPDMTPAQMKKLWNSCSTKTKEVLRAISQYPVAGFDLPSLERKMGVEEGQDLLRGSWSGLTKVTRRILGDDTVRLLVWNDDDDDDQPWRGRLSRMTYESLQSIVG